jgi:hypothetical protein
MNNPDTTHTPAALRKRKARAWQQRLVRLLERVAECQPVTGGDYETCLICGRYWKDKEGAVYLEGHPHDPDCPRLEAPKILEILMANAEN